MKDYLGANRAEALFTDVVPVTGVDQIKVTFSEDVSVGRSSIRVPGKDNRALAIRDFFYDAESATAVWTLASPWPAGSVTVRLDGVVDLQGNLLDGDADGQPGGSFWVRFDSLPGDVNGDGRVDRADHLFVQAHPVATLGDPRYVLALDVDGNARIDAQDLDAVWRLVGTSLPDLPPLRWSATATETDVSIRRILTALARDKYLTGQPAVWAEGDWNGDEVFDRLDIVLALQEGRYMARDMSAV